MLESGIAVVKQRIERETVLLRKAARLHCVLVIIFVIWPIVDELRRLRDWLREVAR